MSGLRRIQRYCPDLLGWSQGKKKKGKKGGERGSQMELNLMRNMKNIKKDFFRCIRQRRWGNEVVLYPLW